jgi:hypothetical protein
MATDRAFMPVADPSAAGLTPRPNVVAEVKTILCILWGNGFFVSLLRASWRGASRFSEQCIIRPAHHPGSVRKFLLLRDCLFGRRRVGDDILRANKELIRDGLFGVSGALTFIALVAFSTKNFAQGNIPSFKMLVCLALAVKLSTIVRRAYATNASRG